MRLELKLLFDQNLPAKLANGLSDLFPKSSHVKHVGLDVSDDELIWQYAKANGYAIISKDSDFHHMSFVHGAPPKIIWLRCGNRSTSELENIIRTRATQIQNFLADADGALLVVNDPSFLR